MSFSTVFEAPVTRTVGDKTYTLKLLTTRDYLPWCAELTATKQEKLKSAMPEVMKPDAKHQALRQIALIDCTPDDIAGVMSIPANTIRALELAATKSGITDPAEQQAFIDAGSMRENERDAYRVSALFSKSQLLQFFPEEIPSALMLLLKAAANGDEAELIRLAKAATDKPEETPSPNVQSPDSQA